MAKSIDIPDCHYPKEPTMVRPSIPTPKHSLYLSNLDDQKFLRFSIKYLFLYRNSVSVETLKTSLSKALVHYHPLAGRLRTSEEDPEKLEVDCNGEGAVLAEGYVDVTAAQFMEGSARPNKSWRKLLYRVEAHSLLGVPPVVIQVTHLSCGGMLLCTAICHCLCDGVGTAQFLNAWSLITANPDIDLPVTPFHDRQMLQPRRPIQVAFTHPEFTPQNLSPPLIQSQEPLVPVSITFTQSQILQLKRLCIPSLKCTSFEVLASHVWRAWIKSLAPPPSLRVKLLFSANVREKLEPALPRGYYGNGFVLGCAESPVEQLVSSNMNYGVRLVQKAKERLDGGYIRSMVDLLQERRVKPDLSASLVISQWAKLGLEGLDFGEGRPLHMGPIASEIYCLFLPVIGDSDAFGMLMSVPESVAENFEHLLASFGDGGEEDGKKEMEEWGISE